MCRNVVIYFTEEAKDGIYRRFYESLVPGGTLFVGSTEQIVNYRELGYISERSFFYKSRNRNNGTRILTPCPIIIDG